MTTDPYRWTGEFADQKLEAEYRASSWPLVQTKGLTAILCTVIFVVAALAEHDRYGWSREFLEIFMVRLLALPVMAAPILLFAKRPDHKLFYFFMSAAQLYLYATFLYVMTDVPVPERSKILSTILILAVFYVVVPNRVQWALLVCSLVTVMFIAAGYMNFGWSLDDSAKVLLTLMIANAAGFHMARSDGKRRRVEFLNLRRQTELNEELRREVLTREAAQRAIRTTEESFESIFYAAPFPILLVDNFDYKLLKANNAARELLPLENDYGDGKPLRILADPEMCNRIANLAISGKSGSTIEVELARGEAELSVFSMSAALIMFKGLPAILLSFQDVTARSREAEILRAAHDQAEAASRSKSEFLANMSHELRTPLNAIIGFSETLGRELFGPVGNPRYKEYAEDIHASGVHLLNLINDILDLSKIEAGHFKLHEEECNIKEIAASACRIVSHRAQQSRIHLIQDIPTDLPQIWVDERALKQILINLISNAVKFSRDGTDVRIEVRETDKSIRFAVIDKGIGIAEENIPKALAPFTQIDGTLSRAHEGTGLGLPLAKHLAELHGGTLVLESKLGTGTSVFVDLPLERVVWRRSGSSPAA